MTFDRRRDRTAQRHGWVLIRFTWDDVTLRPGEVANEVRLLLAVRTPASC
jgi:very-short-patch-repair endonuclease